MRRMTRYGVMIVLGGCLAAASAGSVSAATSDPWITAKTKIALATAGVKPLAVNVDTQDGIVTLHGTVNSTEEKAKAETEARKINGVKEVRNLLQVVPARHEKVVKASDDDLKKRIERTLKDDSQLEGSSISVQSVNDGVVLLAGKADSVSDHLRAIHDAYGVPGVQRVESEVKSPDKLADQEIRRREDESSRTAGAKRDIGTASRDMWITTDTKMRLLADGRTPAMDIDVDTRDGIVTLWGRVPSAQAKTAAEEDAKKVSGVRRVVNQLQVVPSSRKETVKAQDDELEKQVKRAIDARDELQGAKVDTDVKNGVARLTGTVADEQQRLAASIAARSVPGVRAVQNDLNVSVGSR